MDNIIKFPGAPEAPTEQVSEKPQYEVRMNPGGRIEMWSPNFFGISFLLWGSGKNDGGPDMPPPTGGTPVANQNGAKLRMVA